MDDYDPSNKKKTLEAIADIVKLGYQEPLMLKMKRNDLSYL